MKKIDWRVVAIGIGCLTAIEICALFKGIDGVLMTTIVAIIAAAIGFVTPSPIKTK